MRHDQQPPVALSARGLEKTYKAGGNQPAKQALKGVDLDIPRGAIFGLLGPNGAGKSTFINILAGLVIKSSGSANIWGFDIDANPRQARASIGIVPQELSIDPFFTPAEIMNLQAGLYGVPRRQRRTMEILSAMGLADKAQAYARTLSGGMRRRLLVAKAMVHNPPVLVLDEPTAGVDIELRRQLWDYVIELNRQGVTIMLTTHYLEEAEELCDTIGIIDNGTLVACDSTQNLLHQIDNKTLVIRPSAQLDAAPIISGLDCILRDDGQLAVQYNPGQQAAGDVLAQIQGSGIEIADIGSEGADLETVFMKLTGPSSL
ncbi:MAG: multidrug ABC transporter ATP-binding protein [Rhizobiales bacterium TMED143]|nr:multidrug ABC transporter ATP-binding protein [Rhodobiaceae bacterium]OUV92173.1 MAG: multidrug ABC transporter ATP-binding protein [Rhizobiales bacterium TMED143]CAI8314903.1 MAG: Daunorubicin/doxorubicin resistance ATP-binding protein DrrA [Rhodobiaceae bacterium UBA7378]|tara:strand:- start:102 stop:1052 length:951 start_codon:yes stop_codon:yes gene_type:complete